MEPVGWGKEENSGQPLALTELTNRMWIDLTVPTPCDNLSFVFLFPDMLNEEFAAAKGKHKECASIRRMLYHTAWSPVAKPIKPQQVWRELFCWFYNYRSSFRKQCLACWGCAVILCHSGLPLHSLCSLAFTSVLGEGRTSFWDFLLAQCQLTPGAAGTVRSSEHPLHGQLRGGEVHLNYLWHDCFIAKLIENTLNVSQLTAPLLKQNCRADRGFILSILGLPRCRVWGASTAELFILSWDVFSHFGDAHAHFLPRTEITPLTAPSCWVQKTPGRGECLWLLCAAAIGLDPSLFSFTLWPHLSFSHFHWSPGCSW